MMGVSRRFTASSLGGRPPIVNLGLPWPVVPSRRRLACALAVTLLLAGCGDDGEAGSGPTTTPGAEPVPLTPLTVELVDPGAEPREVLAHSFAPGDEWSGDLDFRLELDQVLGVVEGTSRLVTEAVAEDGSATVSYGLEGLTATVSGTGQSPTPSAVQDITGQVVVTPDRTVTLATVRTEAADDFAEVALNLDPRLPFILFPFPSAPVGPGARWDISGPLSLFGAQVEFEAAARLARRAGGRFTVEVEIHLRDPEQVGFALDGIGAIQGELSQVGPLSGSIAVAGTVIPPGQDRPAPASLGLQITEQ